MTEASRIRDGLNRARVHALEVARQCEQGCASIHAKDESALRKQHARAVWAQRDLARELAVTGKEIDRLPMDGLLEESISSARTLSGNRERNTTNATVD